ncbi:hypothetical protein W7K_18040 [Stenotrophomonas geniculata N1]|uniref:Uncharacterized protein n=1 Tax=Stenotrophomonas geniculata N1 TaxID=1167641 RepID=A0A0L8A6C5_9GAMM|nr:hypothetical protein W7K_18040 [Stenotrophomonas geniculata N1]
MKCAGVAGRRVRALGDEGQDGEMNTTDQLPMPVVRVSPAGCAFTTSTDVAAFFDAGRREVTKTGSV